MSTVFYDPKTEAMYADTLTVVESTAIGGSRMAFSVANIPNVGRCIIGAVGSAASITSVIASLESDPKAPLFDAGDFAMLIQSGTGGMYAVSAEHPKLARLEEPDSPNAVGTGRHMVAPLAANGADAACIMNHIKKLDVFSGGETVRAQFNDSIPQIETL